MMEPGGLESVVRVASQLVKEVGFPIFVAVYLLVKVNPSLSQLTKAISDLRDSVRDAASRVIRNSDPKP